MQNLIKKLKLKRRGIAALATLHFFGNPSAKLKIVGVTGTNGNTTTDPISLHKLFTKMKQAGCEYVFMEVSSHALDQNRIAGVKFTGGIFTNLTHDHLDYHKDFAHYFRAKKRFFDSLSSGAFALSNVDNDHGKMMLEDIKAKKYTYGFKNKADFSEKLETNLLGSFNEYNVLAVYAAAILLGFDKDKVKKILKSITLPRGRFEHFTSPNGVLIIVDYAHTPDALEKVFSAVKEINKTGKIISVFGCGGDRDPLKRRMMGKIGAEMSDIAIFTSDNPRNEDPEKIITEMKIDLSMNLLEKVISIVNRREAIKKAVEFARSGDTILCAGKGHEDYQEIKGRKHHFDDMEEFKKSYGGI